MIDEKLLKDLAVLARVHVADDDIAARLADFQAIVGYIAQLDNIVIPDNFQFRHALVNQYRSDVIQNASTETVSRIIELFPDSVGATLAVPKVL